MLEDIRITINAKSINFEEFLKEYKVENVYTRLIIKETEESYISKMHNRHYIWFDVIDFPADKYDIEPYSNLPVVDIEKPPADIHFDELDKFFADKYTFLTKRYRFVDFEKLKEFLLQLHENWRVIATEWLLEKNTNLETLEDSYILTPIRLIYPMFFWDRALALKYLPSKAFIEIKR